MVFSFVFFLNFIIINISSMSICHYWQCPSESLVMYTFEFVYLVNNMRSGEAALAMECPLASECQ